MENLQKRMEDASARVLGFSFPPVHSPLHSLRQTPYDANRYDYEEWFHDFKTHRPIFLTCVFDDYVGLGKGAGNIERIRQTNRHFFNDLHRRIYKKSKRKLPRMVVIERGAGRFHSHMVVETPEHLSLNQFHKILTASWENTKHGVKLHCVVGYDKNGLDDYCSKELGQDNKTFSQVDEKNSYKLPTSSYRPQGGERLVVAPPRKNFPDALPIIQ